MWTEEQIKKAKEDFRVFVFMVWEAIGLPEPTEIQYEMAKSIQHPSSDRTIIMGFRGVAKSFITCCYCAWTLWNDRQKKVMVVSASKDKADANAIFIKRIIHTLPFLECLKATESQRDTQNMFDVGGARPDISPSVKAVGITGQITGTRADLLIADDVEVTNNSATQTQRDLLNERVKEFDAILKPSGRIIYLGTPQNEMSIYNELQQRGYTAIIYPIMYPESQSEREFYGDRLAPYMAKRYDESPQVYQGQPTDPLRFDTEEIQKRKLSYGKAGFSLQFMLNTNLSDQERYPLKLSDLIVSPLDTQEASLKWSWCNEPSNKLNIPCVGLKGDYFYSALSRSSDNMAYTGTVMALDISGRGSDESAYAIVKYLNGYLFLMEVGGYIDGYSDNTLTALSNKAKFYGVNEVVIESNFGDGMFTQLFKPVLNRVHPCSIKEVRNSTQKELRIIDTLEPLMMRHKLIVNQSVIVEDYKVYERDNKYSLFYQMTRLSRDRGSLAHDDRLDALSMAVAYWLEVMDRDEQIGQDDLIEEKLREWLDPDIGIMGSTEEPLRGLGFNILDKHFIK